MLRLNLILIAAAVIPALILMIYIYWQDRLEREPVRLLWGLALQGVVAVFAAIVLEKLGTSILDARVPEGTMTYYALLTFLIIGPAEEGSKYFLLKRRTWNNPNFNCSFDGVVYATYVSLGFALFENIGYTSYYGMGGALIRAGTAIPGHAAFGVFMGVWYGQAKAWEYRGDPGRSRNCRLLALVVPMLLHGLYDYIALRGNSDSVVAFLIFILTMFLAAFLMLKKTARQDRYL